MDSWIIAFDFILKVHSVLNKLVCRCFLKCIPKFRPKMNSNIRYGCMSILNEDSFGFMKASSIEKLFNRYTPKTRYGRNCSHF
jgi:hypothetical protein